MGTKIFWKNHENRLNVALVFHNKFLLWLEKNENRFKGKNLESNNYANVASTSVIKFDLLYFQKST